MDSFLYPNFPNGSKDPSSTSEERFAMNDILFHSDGLDKAIARVENMAEKVRNVDWSALENHLHLRFSQDLEAEKSIERHLWLIKCIDVSIWVSYLEELKMDSLWVGHWVIRAFKQIRTICGSYPEISTPQRQQQGSLPLLQHERVFTLLLEEIVKVVVNNFTAHMDRVRQLLETKVLAGNLELYHQERSLHIVQVEETLKFLQFLLQDGYLKLHAPQAKKIWNCLIENPVFIQDREVGFQWFFELMGDEPNLNPRIIDDFFMSKIVMLNPNLVTETGFECFFRFFKAVNCKSNNVGSESRYHKLDDLEIIGMDYIWKIVLNSNPNIADKAVELLKDCFEKREKFAHGLQDSRNCKVCLVEEVSRVLSPCYHAICCNTCIKSIKICPICRAKIQDSRKIFF